MPRLADHRDARLILLKRKNVTKLKAGIIGATLVIAVGTPFFIQRQAILRLETDSLLQQKNEQMAKLVSENERLSNLLAQISNSDSLPGNEPAELPRLSAEVGALRQQPETIQAPGAGASADYWPRDSWKFVGYLSPATALQSYFWAASKGDVETFRVGITGASQKTLELQSEKVAPLFLSSQVAGLKSVRVLDHEEEGQDTVVLTAAFEKETGKEIKRMLIKKVGMEWKFSGYVNN